MLALALAQALALLAPCVARAQEPGAALPSFEQLEAAGAIIGEIRILNLDIFDLENPEENKLLFRWANALHVQTRVDVIRRALLFHSGEPVSASRMDETERVLRTFRQLYDVDVRAVAYRDGVVDIEVQTRDTWTLDLGFSLSRSGGVNAGSIGFSDYSVLGSGAALSYARSSNVDRSTSELGFSHEHAFDGWTALSYSHANNSDGGRVAGSIAHPFYALDTRWAAGISASRDDRIDAFYNTGVIESQYRTRQNLGEAYAGWSKGRVDGWVQRFSIGVSEQDNAYAFEPGLVAPAQLPADERLGGPFLRFEVIEERFVKQRNRNLIDRTEFVALGLASTVQLGRALVAFGSTRDAWLYSATLARGFEPASDHTLLASAALSGQYTMGQVRRQRFGASGRYYLPQRTRWLFYAAVSGDMLTNPDPTDELLLGGDNGLRGYPQRYQNGTRRALVTLEERVYTDLYLFQLFRIGAAAFYDRGRAWGGAVANSANSDWLSDVGVGLRIFNTRAAFSNVLHVDLAFPLGAPSDIKKVQFLFNVKASF
jgi:hypothetical protein